MKTQTYYKSTGPDRGWWWGVTSGPSIDHGPFQTRDEAEDAARAARITAAAENRD